MSGSDHHDHGHDHGHDGHGHDPADAHAPIEAHDAFGEFQLLEQAVRELLIETGVLTAADVQRQIEYQESRTPALGARIVARAWIDPEFRSALLDDARSALSRTLGIEIPSAPELRVLENTDRVHNLVVCTLCSCYPRMILGIPPAWYKSREYRARAVREPRAVLEEFGLPLPGDVELRVSDSTADLRFLVIPVRPPETEGLDEQELARWVGRDAMIGTGLPHRPAQTTGATPR